MSIEDRDGTSNLRTLPAPIGSSRIAHRMAVALRRRFGDEAFGFDGRLRDGSAALLAEARAWLSDAEWEGCREAVRLPWSARALLVNSFAPWREALSSLELAGHRGFRTLAFDVRCPTGVRGTPPVVGLLAHGDEVVVGVVASAFGHFARRPRRLAASYRQSDLNRWRAAVEAGHWRHLDVATLFRVALALHFTFPDARSTVLYLHLEPRDAAELAPCHRHRRELRELSTLLRDARVRFAHLSFNHLWQAWRRCPQPAFAPVLAAALEARYLVAVAPAET